MIARRILVTLLIALAGAWYAPAALADDTAAVAVNTKDGSSVFRLAFAIKKVGGDVVDNSNAAVAAASCVDCRTVAISIQIVLVTGNPDVVTPTNLALAFNTLCTACETLASAYQWVLGTDEENVRFTPEGRHEINDIRKQLRELGQSDLPVFELQARIDALMQRLGTVLKTELEPVGRPADPGAAGTETTPAETTQTTTQPTETEPPPTTTTETTPTETGTETTTSP